MCRVVTMHASEVAPVRQLDVHFLNVVLLPIELIDSFLDTSCCARFKLGRHTYFLNRSWNCGSRRRTDIGIGERFSRSIWTNRDALETAAILGEPQKALIVQAIEKGCDFSGDFLGGRVELMRNAQSYFISRFNTVDEIPDPCAGWIEKYFALA